MPQLLQQLDPNISSRLLENLLTNIFGDVKLTAEDSIRALTLEQLLEPAHRARLYSLLATKAKELVDLLDADSRLAPNAQGTGELKFLEDIAEKDKSSEGVALIINALSLMRSLDADDYI
jgi:hypothetical protein